MQIKKNMLIQKYKNNIFYLLILSKIFLWNIFSINFVTDNGIIKFIYKLRFGKVGNFAKNFWNTGFPLTIKNFKIFNLFIKFKILEIEIRFLETEF